MKNWLDNITNEQIEEFMKGIKKYDKIEISRNNDIIKVTLLQTSCNEDYGDRVIRYYFNEFGEGYIYRDKLILSPFSEVTKKWFRLLYKANIDEQINGLTYCEAFEQAQEKTLIDDVNIKNSLLQKQINELYSKKESNNAKLNENLGMLHNYINETRRNSSETKSNLIVKSFLKRMSKQGRVDWLKANGYISSSEFEETKSPLMIR